MMVTEERVKLIQTVDLIRTVHQGKKLSVAELYEKAKLNTFSE